jgi:hypothetical protein
MGSTIGRPNAEGSPVKWRRHATTCTAPHDRAAQSGGLICKMVMTCNHLHSSLHGRAAQSGRRSMQPPAHVSRKKMDRTVKGIRDLVIAIQFRGSDGNRQKSIMPLHFRHNRLNSCIRISCESGIFIGTMQSLLHQSDWSNQQTIQQKKEVQRNKSVNPAREARYSSIHL